MDRIRGFLRWISTFFRKKNFEAELSEELDLHLELAVADLVERGIDRQEALRIARRDFGGVERTREQVRESGTLLLIEHLVRDSRQAVRSLARHPLHAFSLVLTLGVGVGCTVAVLALMQKVFVEPLPFPDSHELVLCQTTFNDSPNPWSSGPDYIDYRDQCEGFAALSTIMPFPQMYTVTGGAEPERVSGTAVSPCFFSTLGIEPLYGRSFTSEEGTADSPETVILSHRFWQRHFAGDVGAVGKVLTIDGVGRTIVGIMPEEFSFSFFGDSDFWRPMRPDRDVASLRDRHNWNIIGRLAEGVSMDQVQARADIIAERLAREYPETNGNEDFTKGMLLVGLHDFFVRDYRSGLLLLLAATALLLLIAAANVAGLLLTRDLARRSELAVRRSLGASRGRLLSAILIERAMAGIVAGILGIFVGLLLQPLILRFYPIALPGLDASRFPLTIVFLSPILALIVIVIGGFPSALKSGVGSSESDLRFSSRMTASGRNGFRRGLIFSQIAITVVLLVGAGLLIRSLNGLVRVEPGFDPGNVLIAELELPPARYEDRALRIGFYADLLEQVRHAPGIESAALINYLPIRDPYNWFEVYREGDRESACEINLRSVSTDYFRTMQIALVRGRPIGAEDTRENPACVISRTLAEQLYPASDPIGQRVVLDMFGREIAMRIVGVAGDVLVEGLSADPGAVLYAAYPVIPYTRMIAVLKTEGAILPALTALKETARRLDSDIPVSRVAMMEDLISESVSERRTMTIILTLYAVIPLFLAAVGLYGLLACIVRERFREIGVRMALGADPRAVVRLILGQGLGLVGLGLLAGSVGALGATRLIRNQLFGVAPTDPMTFLGVGLMVAVVALAACLVPTLQAARVDPNTALRVE